MLFINSKPNSVFISIIKIYHVNNNEDIYEGIAKYRYVSCVSDDESDVILERLHQCDSSQPSTFDV